VSGKRRADRYRDAVHVYHETGKTENICRVTIRILEIGELKKHEAVYGK
jgi:hypothetical protein